MAARYSSLGTTSATYQIGKSGTIIKHNTGVMEIRDSGDIDYATLQSGSLITDFITIDGNTISSNATNSDLELDPSGTGHVVHLGTGSQILNVGTTGERAGDIQGAFRYNTSLTVIEWYTGSVWAQPDTGGGEANQNAYQVVTGDTGTATADDPADTIAITGSFGVITAATAGASAALDIQLDSVSLADTAIAGGDLTIFFDITDTNDPKKRSWTNVISDLNLAVLGSITLGTDTSGNFVVDVVGTTNEVTVSHTPSEGSTATIGLPNEVIISTALSVGGSTLEDWDPLYDAIQVGGVGSLSSHSAATAGQSTFLSHNAYFDDTDNRWEYFATASDEAVRIEMINGTMVFDVATAGTQDTAITWLPALTINNDQSMTTGGDIIPDTDSTDNLGSTGVRWANIWGDTITGAFTGNLTGNADSATVAATVTIADSSDDTTLFVTMTTDATGDEALLSDAQLTYNASTNNLTTTTFTGALAGNATTATTATNATNVALTNEATDTTTFFVFGNAATGNEPLHTNANLAFNSNTGVVTFGDDLIITGDLTVNGTTTTVNTATLAIEDPLISLATGNNTTDTVDIGMYGLYDSSGSLDLFGGLFRDASDNKWKLYVDSQTEPTTTVNTGATGHTVATLVADLEGRLTLADTSSTTTFVILSDDATGLSAPLTDGGLTYNASTANLSTTTFTGALTGIASNATLAATSTIADSGDDTSLFLIMATDATGPEALLSDAQLTYNASTNTLTTTTFSGALSGNATTATTLATSRDFSATGDVTTSSAQGFDGSGNVALPLVLDLNNLATDATGGATTDYIAFVDVSDSNLSQKVLVSDFITNSGLASADPLARRAAVAQAASTNIGAALPSDAYVTRVVVDITTAYDNSSVMTVSAAGGVTALAIAIDIDPLVIGTYIVDLPVSAASTGQVTADLTLTPSVGVSTVWVEYRIVP